MDNIVEKNVLIADFMGMKYGDERKFVEGEWIHSIQSLSRFRQDWNWLMDVITKITTLSEFNSYPNDTDFWDAYNSIDRQATHNACVEFIKWFNEQK